MSYNPQNPNGNTGAANSTPVTLASDTNGPVKIYDGTNTANVVAGDTGFNGVSTAVATKTYTFTTSTAGAQTILANTPCEGFATVEVAYSSVGSGLALTAQFSPSSGGTYINSSQWQNTVNGLYGNSPIGNVTTQAYFAPVHGNYFQLAVSALTSGTFAGTVTFRATSPSQGVMTAGQVGTWTVGSNSATGSGTPANAFLMGVSDGTDLRSIVQPSVANTTTGTGVVAVSPMLYNGTDYYTNTTNSTTYTSKYGADVNLLGTLGTAFSTAGKIDITAIPTGTNSIGKISDITNVEAAVGGGTAPTSSVVGGGVYNTTAPTPTAGQGVAFQTDSSGNEKVYLATKLDATNDAITNYEGGNSYAYIAAGAAATHVVKASPGILHSITFNGPASATNVTTIYDNASTSGTVIGVPLATAVVSPETVIYDIAFANGLTIITTVANGADMTVSYR